MSASEVVLHPERGVCIQGGCLHLGLFCIQKGGSASSEGVCIRGCSASRKGGLYPGRVSASGVVLHPERGVCIEPPHRILWDTVNERAVHIFLECILVNICFRFSITQTTQNVSTNRFLCLVHLVFEILLQCFGSFTCNKFDKKQHLFLFP